MILITLLKSVLLDGGAHTIGFLSVFETRQTPSDYNNNTVGTHLLLRTHPYSKSCPFSCLVLIISHISLFCATDRADLRVSQQPGGKMV